MIDNLISDNKDRDQFFGLIFVITFFILSHLLKKMAGFELIWSGVLMAFLSLCIAAIMDVKMPFKNKHAWIMITVGITFPMLLVLGV
jgi:hypothetical protein